MPAREFFEVAKSTSGASMSQYDTEVEGRLQALESKASNTPQPQAIGGATLDRLEALEQQVTQLVSILNSVPQVTDHAPKSADGVRRVG